MPLRLDAATFADSLAGHLALELREGQEDVEREPSHARRGVE
jgi:hypothetical protein